MFTATVLDQVGTPANAADVQLLPVSGISAAQTFTLRVYLYEVPNVAPRNWIEIRDFTHVSPGGETSQEVFDDIDFQVEGSPPLHAVVTGQDDSLLAVEPETGFLIRVALLIDGVAQPGSFVPQSITAPPVTGNLSSGFVQTDHVTAVRVVQDGFPIEVFERGMNQTGSSVGIGVSSENPNVDPNSWTLLDQKGVARTPQQAGAIGLAQGVNPILLGAPADKQNPANIGNDGALVGEKPAELVTLAEGWKQEA